MSDGRDLASAGVSSTRTRWITNPARRLAWFLIRPFIATLVDRQAHQQQTFEHQLREAKRFLGSHALQKDLAAIAYRLGSIEASLPEIRDSHGNQTKHLSSLESNSKLAADQISALQSNVMELRAQLSERSGLLDRLDKFGRTDFIDVRSSIESQSSRIGQLAAEVDQLRAAYPSIRGSSTFIVPDTSLRLTIGKFGKFLVREPDVVGEAVARGEFWDDHLKRVIEANGAPDRIAIDVGAYIGFHSVYMSRFFKEVCAFEPQEDIFRMLCANLLINNCRNVRAFNIAIYDRPGKMRIADPHNQEIPVPRDGARVNYDVIGNAAALAFEMVEGSGNGAVDAITLDSLQLPNVGLIKIDAQGSDLRILRGATETISRSRPTIVFEFEQDLSKPHGTSLVDCEEYFRSVDYDLKLLKQHAPGKQFDYVATPRENLSGP